MNDLELCIKFAELEDVDYLVYRGNNLLYPNDQGYMVENGVTCAWYNPITDLALNCAARDKYKVEVDYSMHNAAIYFPAIFNEVNFKTYSDIPRAVIACILKSKGLL